MEKMLFGYNSRDWGFFKPRQTEAPEAGSRASLQACTVKRPRKFTHKRMQVVKKTLFTLLLVQVIQFLK